MPSYRTPGVYREDLYARPSPGLRTGVPAFLGYAPEPGAEVNTPVRLILWPQFEEQFGRPTAARTAPHGYLASSVRGFFENGGEICYVVPLVNEDHDTNAALEAGLAALEPLDDIDLVCAPDIMRDAEPDPGWSKARELQQMVLDHCTRTGDRFAILDSPVGATVSQVLAHRGAAPNEKGGLTGENGALYFPWLDVGLREETDEATFPQVLYVPPCGHVAGVYARTDGEVGVHKAPANEVLHGVLDLQAQVTDAVQGDLNTQGINCLRAFPGRGIRVWGARTLSRHPAWIYVNVRRLFLTVGRWIDRSMPNLVFEPNDIRLWARINRELNAYFNGLFRQGALKGATAAEAFYVKCDDETNPPEVREAGQVVTEIGLAPAIPTEFVVIRIIHGPSGVTIAGPVRPEESA